MLLKAKRVVVINVLIETCADDGNPEAYVDVCGYGAVGCKGTFRDPVCMCNSSNYYIASEDRRSCLLGTLIILLMNIPD